MEHLATSPRTGYWTAIHPVNQDDIFIRLDALQPHRDYLVNVDGYLHDFCSFTLELSTQPKGIPKELIADVDARLASTGSAATLTWSISPDSSSVTELFEIWSRAAGQPKSALVGSVPFDRNTYGQPRLNYSFADSMSAAGQQYKIVAVRVRRGNSSLILPFRIICSKLTTRRSTTSGCRLITGSMCQ